MGGKAKTIAGASDTSPRKFKTNRSNETAAKTQRSFFTSPSSSICLSALPCGTPG